MSKHYKSLKLNRPRLRPLSVAFNYILLFMSLENHWKTANGNLSDLESTSRVTMHQAMKTFMSIAHKLLQK